MLEKRKKLTQAKLGEYLNVTDKAVSKWECGKCLPDSSLFEKISKVLEVSMSELLKGEYIEEENVEVESNKTINSLLNIIYYSNLFCYMVTWCKSLSTIFLRIY